MFFLLIMEILYVLPSPQLIDTDRWLVNRRQKLMEDKKLYPDPIVSIMGAFRGVELTAVCVT